MLADKNLHPKMRKIDFFVGIPLLVAVGFIRDMLDFFWRPFKRFIWNFNRTRRSNRPRILVIKYSDVDEGVLMLPSLHMLRKTLKEAHITFLGGPAVGTFLIKTKLIDKAEGFSLGTVFQMRRASFMMVIDFETWMRTTAIAASLMKSPVTVGFETEGEFKHGSFDATTEFDPKIHLAENFWNLVATACEDCGHSPTSTFATDRDEVKTEMRRLLPERSREIVHMSVPEKFNILSPCTPLTEKFKRWPVENWVGLLENLKTIDPKCPSLVIGKNEYENKSVITPLVEKGAIPWVDKLSFDEMFQLFTNAKCIYTLDSFMAQLASLLNDRVVLLQAPSSQQNLLWGGVAVKSKAMCTPCLTGQRDYGCVDPACMKSIETEKVLKAI